MRIPPDKFLARRTCLCCERPWAPGGNLYTWEHGVPQLLGGRLESRLFCKDCNSLFGSSIDISLLDCGLVQLALFDLRARSRVAARQFPRLQRKFSRWSGAPRRPDCHYRAVFAPQYVADTPNLLAPHVHHRAEFEPQHLFRWWREESGRRRGSGLILLGTSEFLRAAQSLQSATTGIRIQIPGGGDLHYDPNGQITYEFPSTVAWRPIVKIALTTLSMFRNDLQLRVITGSGLLPTGEVLRRIRDLDPSLQNPLQAGPRWKAGAAPQIDLRFRHYRERLLGISVGLLGVFCGRLLVQADPSPYPLDEFAHYTCGIDTGEELLFGSEPDFVARQAVQLNSRETARSYIEHLRGDAVPWSEVPRDAP